MWDPSPVPSSGEVCLQMGFWCLGHPVEGIPWIPAQRRGLALVALLPLLVPTKPHANRQQTWRMPEETVSIGLEPL